MSRDEATNLFVLEEAQHLAPKILKKAVVTDTWATVDFATRLRKRDVGLIVISQSLSNIEDDMRKNLQNNFYFRIEDGDDIVKVAKSLGYNWWAALDHFTKKFLVMKPRECVVKTSLFENPNS